MRKVVRIGAKSKRGRQQPAVQAEGDRLEIDARAELIQALGRPRRAEDAALLKLLKGLSCRDYEACVEPAAETFGLTASSLSRRFKRAGAKKLAEMAERDLSGYDLVAFGLPPWSPSLLDGKTFGDDQMTIGLGVFKELGRSFYGAEPHREPEFSGGPADGQGRLLEERGPETPLAGHGALGHRAAITKSVRLQATGPPAQGVANALERLPRRGGVTPWCRSQFQLRMALTPLVCPAT